ncbi:hypothetical protein C7447_102373 [Tenacibaculum adriaticum]|uniref:Uncharacterized protein n=1 Tax=Tenacibaculum adriaticum TaxID=413713 RepID=A0A5S5DTF5_9FLAO|nr:hypothetical protein [Tenacibaculum adriaticum]TYP99055.1 hypothetical protein C7447_102373 [Tenacibaculum adriaticum]
MYVVVYVFVSDCGIKNSSSLDIPYYVRINTAVVVLGFKESY